MKAIAILLVAMILLLGCTSSKGNSGATSNENASGPSTRQSETPSSSSSNQGLNQSSTPTPATVADAGDVTTDMDDLLKSLEDAENTLK